MLPKYQIQRASREHLSALPEIERAAARIFPKEVLAEGLGDHTTSVEAFDLARQQGYLWVALDGEGNPVGFAMVTDHGSILHLEEVDVHPQYQRLGIGTALIETVCWYAEDMSYQGVSLTTFSTIPWNAPWYEKLGFRKLREGELTKALKVILQDEARRGLDPKIRVAMVWEIS
jgi:GNAT superfamily N-acetyltransferase